MHFFTYEDFSFEATTEATSTLKGFSPLGKEKDRVNRRNNNPATLIIPIFDNEGRRVTKIKGSAFTNACIREIQVGWNNVEEIGGRAFAYCRLEAIPRFWDNVRNIGDHAFANQQDNKELRIPPRWSLVEL